MSTSDRRQRAFTILEMLVVIAIIATLIGLLMPALQSARNRGRKTAELNRIRQVFIGWELYANANGDYALPGYLETDVQQRWNVTYKFPDGTKVPPAPTYTNDQPNLAGPWTWRLLSYLDYSHDLVHYYTNEDNPDKLAMSDPAEAQDIALQPAFAYNGHYIGGYYKLRRIAGSDGHGSVVPMTTFTTATDVNGRIVNLVSRSASAVSRPSEIVNFCTASRLPRGIVRNVPDDAPGWHLANPPFLTDERQWGDAGGTASQLQVFVDECPTPIGRYSGDAVVVFIDGHVDQHPPLWLDDMRKWNDEADAADWYHGQPQ